MKKVAGVVPLFVSVLALAGCGSGGTDAAEPPPAESSDTQAGEASSAPTPSVAPATGPRVRVDELTLRLPDGFSRPRPMLGLGYTSLGPGGSIVAVAEVEAQSKTDSSLERSMRRSTLWGDIEPARAADRLVDGVTMIHLHAGSTPGMYDDVFGAHVGEHLVSLEFTLAGGPRARERLVESVLATAEWRD